MATRDELRGLIQDQPRQEIGKVVAYGDGVSNEFLLPRRPIITDTLSVFIDGIGIPSTDYTADLITGTLTITDIPDAGAAITASYQYAALSDTELDEVLYRNPGSIYLAAAEAIQLILTGRGRLANFAKGDSRVDMDAARKDLMELAKHYRRLGSSASGTRIESFDYPADTTGDDD